MVSGLRTNKGRSVDRELQKTKEACIARLREASLHPHTAVPHASIGSILLIGRGEIHIR